VLFDDSPPSSLTGIARLAAQSPVLEAKSRVRYFEIETRSVLNRTRPGMPFRWTINPYRGCEFGCKYCYARYTHEFMGMEDPWLFEDQIYAKSDLPSILREELRRTDPADAIAIGTATDPYQPPRNVSAAPARFSKYLQPAADAASPSPANPTWSCAISICCRRSRRATCSVSTSPSPRSIVNWRACWSRVHRARTYA
jgi:hypothetical protein